MGTRLKTSVLVAVAALGLAASLAGCAGEAGGTGGTDAPKNEKAESAKYEADFMACMKEKGVEVFAPEDAPAAPPTSEDPASGAPTAEDFNTAANECEEKLGTPPGAGTPQEAQEEILGVTKCIRDAGYEVDDPKPGDESFMIPGDVPADVVNKCVG